MKYEKWLPAGSVVLLKDSSKRLMIIGFLQSTRADSSKIYDYSGCLYPEGYQDGDHVYLFDHDQIEKVYAVGYMDEEQFGCEERLIEAEAGLRKE